MAEKSILEQALLQVQTLEEAVKQNAKGILASTMKQELSELLKESQEEEDETVNPTMDEQPNPDEEEKDDIAADDEDTDDETADDETSDDETSDDDSDVENDDTDLDNEPSKGIDSLDTDSDVEGTDTDDMSDMGTDADDMDSDDDDVTDMTQASDDEVMKVFKAMKPEDGVVVKKDGNKIEFKHGEDEYIIKLDDESSVESEPFEPSGLEAESEGDEDESTLYEIDLEESDEEEQKEGSTKEMEATEAARTKSNPHGNKNGMKRAGLPSKKMYKAGSGINEEVETLKKQNGEYKKALVLFKDKLNEVAIFNANLAYFTRLVTETSTTKQEKLNILKRFDSVSTMSESKTLFNTIKSELETKKPVTETVANKISNTPTTSSSQEVLAESKAYENPQFKRMKDLMMKIK
jgi:hypothetical protein